MLPPVKQMSDESDFFFATRDQRFEQKKQQILQSMGRTRIFLVACFSVWLMVSCVNIVMQFVCMSSQWTESVTEVTVVLSFNILMIAINVFSIFVFVSQPKSPVAVNFVLVLHSILVFAEGMAVISTLYPGFGDTIHINNTTTDDTMFDLMSDSDYVVPDFLLVMAFVVLFFHVVLTILVDYTRRLNQRLVGLSAEQVQSDPKIHAKVRESEDLVAYATTPVTRKFITNPHSHPFA